jgi:hypothetical protein
MLDDSVSNLDWRGKSARQPDAYLVERLGADQLWVQSEAGRRKKRATFAEKRRDDVDLDFTHPEPEAMPSQFPKARDFQ